MQTILKPRQPQKNADKPAARNVNTSGGRSFSIEFLRFYATVQVLLIHTSGPWVALFIAKNPWWAACVIDSFARPAVPLFLMISGMLLLREEYDKAESLGEFLKRRFSRVFVPLITWSLIYLGYRFIHHDPAIELNNMAALLSSPACYHLGFLYFLTGLYLAAPILKVFVRNAADREVKYLVGLWFVFECVSPLVGSLTGFRLPITCALTGGYLGYFVLGYLLSQTKLSGKRLGWALVAIAGSLGCTIVATYLLTENGPTRAVNELFFNYTNPIIVIYSTLTFVVIRSVSLSLPVRLEKICRSVVASIAAASFTIYLVHPIILEQVKLWLGFVAHLPGNKFCMTALAIFAIAATTCGASWLFFMLARKARLPAWIIP